MEAHYTITPARAEHLEALTGIELAAATMLRGHAPESVLAESTPQAGFLRAQQEGRLWIALCGETPVGFALVEWLAVDLPHLQEMDVAPEHGRRGIGTALLRAVLAGVARAGPAQITLTTFRNVPWNMPFYARQGFVEIPPHELRPELEAVLRDEAGRGLDRAQRVAMRFSMNTAGPTAGGESPRLGSDPTR